MISKCNCVHPCQDKMYGKNNRVFNNCKLKGGMRGLRCTVCSEEKELKGVDK